MIPSLPCEIWHAVLVLGGPLALCDDVHVDRSIVATTRIQRRARAVRVDLATLKNGDDVCVSTFGNVRRRGVVVSTTEPLLVVMVVRKHFLSRQYYFFPSPVHVLRKCEVRSSKVLI